MNEQTVLKFWFEEVQPKDWYVKSLDFDKNIKKRFGALYESAIRGELFEWRRTAEGRLAEIIILDQFSRNMFRDLKEAFAFDSMALTLAQEASLVEDIKKLTPPKRAFVYMPFMHSESKYIHEKAMQLFAEPGLENSLEFEKKHKAIIDRFGRYPHRNSILGRESTKEELEFLEGPNSSF